MKKLVILAVVLAVLAAVLLGQTFTYVGAAKCQICHRTEKQGRQYPIWQASKHSQSFAALSSPQAADYATPLGVKEPASDPKCLKCHAPLFQKAPELKAEGVTCEVCHGPGSEYKQFSVMKDKAEAVKKGLVLYANTEAVKTWCLTCHANAHNLPFDFASAWNKIKHNIPKS
jgi:hypothetical protein